jgi:hypothetical protein
MPESHRLYLDHMLRVEVAQALRNGGGDVGEILTFGKEGPTVHGSPAECGISYLYLIHQGVQTAKGLRQMAHRLRKSNSASLSRKTILLR